jgi:hypothetical protein
MDLALPDHIQPTIKLFFKVFDPFLITLPDLGHGHWPIPDVQKFARIGVLAFVGMIMAAVHFNPVVPFGDVAIQLVLADPLLTAWWHGRLDVDLMMVAIKGQILECESALVVASIIAFMRDNCKPICDQMVHPEMLHASGCDL